MVTDSLEAKKKVVQILGEIYVFVNNSGLF